MAKMPAYDTWSIFYILLGFPYVWSVQGRQSCMDRRDSIGVLVCIFLPYKHFILIAFSKKPLNK